jgi:hypothetical protein
MEETADEIKKLISMIADTKAMADRRVLQAKILTHFIYFENEVHHAIMSNSGQDEFFDITGEEHF